MELFSTEDSGEERSYFLVCRQIAGILSTGAGQEYSEERIGSNRVCIPETIRIDELLKFELPPEKIKILFAERRSQK
jgi:hypothetical protein